MTNSNEFVPFRDGDAGQKARAAAPIPQPSNFRTSLLAKTSVLKHHKYITNYAVIVSRESDPFGTEPLAEDSLNATQSKIAPDLEESANEAFHPKRPDAMQKVIIQLKSETNLNDMAGDLSDTERTAVFAREVQASREKKGIIVTDLVQVGGRFKKAYNNVGLVSAELPLSKINELVKSDVVAYVSPDREIQSFQHIGATTGYYIPGINDRGDSDPNTWLIGGVGHIAVIDSGIDNEHDPLNWQSGTTALPKVKYSKDFTGQNTTTDTYGHGTHVASMFAGDSSFSNAAYQGVAPASNLINLRVLNGTGLGTSSNLIAALDCFLYGNDLMVKWQGMYANGVLVGDGTTFSGTTLTRSSTLTQGTNMTLYQGAIRNNGVLVGDGTLYLSANAMAGTFTPWVNAQGRTGRRRSSSR